MKGGQTTVAHQNRIQFRMNQMCSWIIRRSYMVIYREVEHREARIRSDQMIPSNRQIIQLHLQWTVKSEVEDTGSVNQLSSSWTPSLCSQLKKPSKLVVWRLKSQFNFQPLPAAFQAPPSIYLFWINVISPPLSQHPTEWSLSADPHFVS